MDVTEKKIRPYNSCINTYPNKNVWQCLNWQKMILSKFINFLSKLQKKCKFQWLQNRINHLRWTTNTFLYKFKIKQDPLCSFCKKNENMIHLLWKCENVQILLEALDNWTLKNGNFTLNYNKKTFILGYHKEKNSLISNNILLANKYYIYTCRCLSKNIALTALIYIF